MNNTPDAITLNNTHEQYTRCNNIEILGITVTVKDEHLKIR